MEKFFKMVKFFKVFEKIFKGNGMNIKIDEPESLDSITANRLLTD